MELIISGIIVALLSYTLPKLIENIFRRRVDVSAAEKLDAEKEILLSKSEYDTIQSLTEQLAEARVSITRYRRRLREHGIDPDSDTGPIKNGTAQT